MSGLASLVKSHDYDRYIATLFAPAAKRHTLFSLYAFDAEVSRITEVVHDTIPGEIRLQWWREVAHGERDSEARGHPVASALLTTIRDHTLPRDAFDAYCEAKIFDFYQDSMPDSTALEAYFGATHSCMVQLAAMVLDQDAARGASEAAGHAGVAKGIALMLRDLPLIRRRGQGFVPLTVLAAAGVTQEEFAGSPSPAALGRLYEAITALGHEHLDKFNRSAERLAPSLRPAFASMSTIARRLKAIETGPNETFAVSEPSQLLRLWDVAWGFVR